MRDECTAPEEWRAVVGYEGRYEVSSLGRVRSLLPKMRNRNGSIFTPTIVRGYPQVHLRKPGHSQLRYVHHLVAFAFIGARPFPEAEIRHLDGTRTNNAVLNLRWGTRKENGADKVRHGQSLHGQRSPMAKLTDDMIRAIRAEYAQGGCTQRVLAQKHGIDESQVSRIVRRDPQGGWAHVE